MYKSFLIIDQNYSGKENMEKDIFLLESFPPELDFILRFYSWEPPTLSLGYFQKEEIIDFFELKKLGYQWVRRPTGGGAILHNQEITYSIIANEKIVKGMSTEDSYKFLAQWIIQGLKRLGIQTSFRETASSFSQQICFLNHSSFDIIFKGRKLVGSAQRRKNRAVLQHGSIPLEIDENIFKIIKEDVVNRDEIISLNEIFQKKLSFSEVVDCLIEGAVAAGFIVPPLDKGGFEQRACK